MKRFLTTVTVTALALTGVVLATPAHQEVTHSPSALTYERQAAQVSRSLQRRSVEQVKHDAAQTAELNRRARIKAEQARLARIAQQKREAAQKAKLERLKRERAQEVARERAREAKSANTEKHESQVSGSAPPGIASCIAKYESGGNPRAENPTSSASGLYQFIDSTWREVTGRSDRAKDAPVSVQTAAFYELWDGGRGASHWVTRHKCGY